MAINKERLAKGIKALRSGEFKQGSGALLEMVTVATEDGETRVAQYCCLGVLTVVAINDGCEGIRYIRDPDPNLNDRAWFQVCRRDGETGCVCHEDESGWGNGGNGILPAQVADYYGFDDCDPALIDPLGFRTIDGTRCTATTLNDRVGRDFATIALAFENTYLKGE